MFIFKGDAIFDVRGQETLCKYAKDDDSRYLFPLRMPDLSCHADIRNRVHNFQVLG